MIGNLLSVPLASFSLSDPYVMIIGASLIILLSYTFDFIAKKFNLPSVLLLIGTGIGLQYLFKNLGLKFDEQIFSILEVLGIIGLILIVLEAALDLKLTKDKRKLILRAFFVALFVLLVTTLFIAFAIANIVKTDLLHATVYAVPLSIMSSAIVLPSVGGLADEKREFMIYEATFSDILGIILFFFLTRLDPNSIDLANAAFAELGRTIITILISVVASYGLVYFISKVTRKANFFTIFAMLMIFYSAGKLFGLSSLIMIMTFGLILYNPKLFFRGWLKRLIDHEKHARIVEDFKLLTHQSAFLVRTFFFVVFGMVITLSALTEVNVILLSAIILGAIYLVRFAHLWAVRTHRKDTILPELFIAPRGLITVLLFFAIPEQYKLEGFNDGIMFVEIIATALIMMFALMFAKKEYTVIEDLTTFDNTAMLGFGRDAEDVEADATKKG